MSDDLEGLDELERQLREAHSFAPRPGLQAEVGARLRAGPAVPWAGLSAAAAVLLAVVGVGLLLHLAAPPGHGASGSGATGPSSYGLSGGGAAPADKAAAGFGPLPAPPATSPTAISPIAGSTAAGRAVVYRVFGGTVTSASYAITPAPAGARLLYVTVPDGAALYLEPVYVLANGAVETALTPDELRG